MQDPKYAYPYPAQGNSNFTFAHCFLFLIDGMVSMMILIWNNGHGFLLQQKDVFTTLIMKSIYLVQHKSTQFCGNYVLVDVGYYHGPPVMAPPQYAAAPPRSSGFLEGWLVIKCSWLLLFCTQRFILYSVTQKSFSSHPLICCDLVLTAILFLCLFFCVIQVFNIEGVSSLTDDQRWNVSVISQ